MNSSYIGNKDMKEIGNEKADKLARKGRMNLNDNDTRLNKLGISQKTIETRTRNI